MILIEHQRRWDSQNHPKGEWEYAGFFEENQEVINAMRHYSRKIEVYHCLKCDSTDITCVNKWDLKCNACENLDTETISNYYATLDFSLDDIKKE